MHLLRYDPELGTVHEVPESEYEKDLCCKYIRCQGKRLVIPRFTPNGWSEVVWQHPDWRPFSIRRRSWLGRLIRTPKLLRQQMQAGLPLIPALRLVLLTLKP